MEQDELSSFKERAKVISKEITDRLGKGIDVQEVIIGVLAGHIVNIEMNIEKIVDYINKSQATSQPPTI
jgi:uncharacterized membrane protein YqgA involved in biofilm formation